MKHGWLAVILVISTLTKIQPIFDSHYFQNTFAANPLHMTGLKGPGTS